MKRLYKLAGPYLSQVKARIALLIFLSAILGLLSVALPYITGSFLDFLISENATPNNLLIFCVLFLVVSLANLALSYVSSMARVKVNTTLSYKVNKDTIDHVHQVPYTEMRGRSAVELTQKINSDSIQIISFCVATLCNIVVNILTFIAPLVLLFLINPFIAGLILFFALIYSFAYLYMRKKLYKTGYEYKEAQALFFGKLSDQLVYFKFIKDNGLFKFMLERLDTAFQNIYDKTILFQRISYLFVSLDSLIMTVSQISLFVVGGILVIEGRLTIGEFSIINSYVGAIIASIRYFFGLGREVQNTLVSHDRLKGISDIPRAKNGSKKIEYLDRVELKSVSCWLSGQKIINDLSYMFEKGKSYAIVGQNGSGKSTLVNILLGEYQDEIDGNVLYGDIEQGSVDMVDLRKEQIGICEQEPMLFADTLEFNLILDGDKEIIDSEEAVKLLKLDLLIDKLSNGLSTEVTNGCGLSGGEKQKIALARTLMKNRQILIFDEPTSALDVDTKKKLIEFMQEMKRNKILIVVTHDNDIISEFDEVLEMRRDGPVME